MFFLFVTKGLSGSESKSRVHLWRLHSGLEVGAGHRSGGGLMPGRPGAGHVRTLCLQYVNVFTCLSFKKGLHILFFKNLKKVKKMNLYFILHVCRIHNSNLSEENILLSVQNNTGNQVTRQLRLRYRRYRRVLSAG